VKKLCLILFIILAFSCEKPNQFTSVEGYVTDYYSKEPIAGISLEISEIKPFDFFKADLVTKTVVSNIDGYYYYEFYNKENRWYEIKSFPTENYFNIGSRTISEGKTNTMNFAIKPFKTLTLNCYNQNNTFNCFAISSFINNYDFFCYPCNELTIIDLKIVPENRNDFCIKISHLYEINKSDTSKIEYLKFFAGKNDTTINYYY
jgi:hypothetical protein